MSSFDYFNGKREINPKRRRAGLITLLKFLDYDEEEIKQNG